MIKVIKNGTVLTMSPNREKIENIDIVIKDNEIIELVDDYKGQYDELIDATNKIVMPGIINAHTHLGMSYFRATNDNLTLQDWLNNKIWPIEDKMTDDDVYYGALLSCIEMIKTGTTTSNDMYFSSMRAIDALLETKVRCLFTRCLSDINNNGNKVIDEFLELYNKYKDNDLIKFSVAPHAMYTCNLEYLKKCSLLATKLNLPVHMHYLENKQEIEDIKRIYNIKPIDVLKKSGLINNKLILAHCTYLDDENLEEFKGKDISIAHNPISNLNLGCGVANIVKYKDYANICLGTDSQGSGNNLNMFYHMSIVDLLQKGKYTDSTVISSYEVLKMATINGAKALGMNDIGSIEVGKKADIIMLDLEDSQAAPHIDLITNIVHNAYNNVSMTMINGNILMKDKKLLLKIEENEIINIINNRIKKLL
ncbi:MAG: amidohydrolase [Bacilli bacterium]|nr:amidohydrolase [Bacilli bacterium]